MFQKDVDNLEIEHANFGVRSAVPSYGRIAPQTKI